MKKRKIKKRIKGEFFLTREIIDKKNLEPYLSAVFGGDAVVMELKELGTGVHGKAYLISLKWGLRTGLQQ